jgi:hypothetical protein
VFVVRDAGQQKLGERSVALAVEQGARLRGDFRLAFREPAQLPAGGGLHFRIRAFRHFAKNAQRPVRDLRGAVLGGAGQVRGRVRAGLTKTAGGLIAGLEVGAVEIADPVLNLFRGRRIGAEGGGRHRQGDRGEEQPPHGPPQPLR